MKSHSETAGQRSTASSSRDSGHAHRRWRVLSRRRLGATVGLIVPVLGLGVGVAACGGSSSSPAATTTATAVASSSGSGGFAGGSGSGGGSNARSTNAAGGSLGTVSGVSSSSVTLSTPTGEKVTVNERSSTVYEEGTSTAAASSVTQGKTVLVFGDVDSTTVTASQVIVGPAISLQQASANVAAFSKGSDDKSKSVGQIPADYTQGSGTLVSGTKANEATEAALKSYAGGVVDRVVQLGNGDYEVHMIGVNWPHHVFVNQAFKVIGAND
jgi:hypothetical protein